MTEKPERKHTRRWRRALLPAACILCTVSSLLLPGCGTKMCKITVPDQLTQHIMEHNLPKSTALFGIRTEDVADYIREEIPYTPDEYGIVGLTAMRDVRISCTQEQQQNWVRAFDELIGKIEEEVRENGNDLKIPDSCTSMIYHVRYQYYDEDEYRFYHNFASRLQSILLLRQLMDGEKDLALHTEIRDIRTEEITETGDWPEKIRFVHGYLELEEKEAEEQS